MKDNNYHPQTQISPHIYVLKKVFPESGEMIITENRALNKKLGEMITLDAFAKIVCSGC